MFWNLIFLMVQQLKLRRLLRGMENKEELHRLENSNLPVSSSIIMHSNYAHIYKTFF
jgi:hypothetical protein